MGLHHGRPGVCGHVDATGHCHGYILWLGVPPDAGSSLFYQEHCQFVVDSMPIQIFYLSICLDWRFSRIDPRCKALDRSCSKYWNLKMCGSYRHFLFHFFFLPSSLTHIFATYFILSPRTVKRAVLAILLFSVFACLLTYVCPFSCQ